MSRTFALLKPELVAYPPLARWIIAEVHNTGMEIRSGARLWLSREQAERLYEEHRGRFYFERLIVHMTSGPIIAMEIGSSNKATSSLSAVVQWRGVLLDGLRSRLSLSDTRNLGHGADSEESAMRELSLFVDELRPLKGHSDAIYALTSTGKCIV